MVYSVCDNCTHRDVCKMQEHCQKVEEAFRGIEVDNSFVITVLCKYKDTDRRVMYP